MNSDSIATVHVVDDDERMCSLIADYLVQRDISVSVCHNGEEAVQLIKSNSPDLVVLDLMLPGKDGLSVCREVRADYTGKILMLTAIDDTAEEITGLEIGADDYINKPVSPRLLLARIRAALRRSDLAEAKNRNTEQVGALVVDKSNRSAVLDGRTLKLTTTEFDLLWLLISRAGDVVSREYLHAELFRLDLTPDDRRIDLFVSRLRKSLEDEPSAPRYIKTVRGKGYLMGTGE